MDGDRRQFAGEEASSLFNGRQACVVRKCICVNDVTPGRGISASRGVDHDLDPELVCIGL